MTPDETRLSEARAQRIRTLKASRPDLTWERIARECGVTLRTAQTWGERGGIGYENARRLARVFDVDVSYLLLGNDTPVLPEHQTALARIEAKLDELLTLIAECERPELADAEAA
jgi:transcriptional regulator with XRE-family HTH domain